MIKNPSLTNSSASFWVKASAGSGKTKILTDRALSLLIEGVAPNNILCLTFTRAAAAEMESRILKTLSIWAYQEKTQLSKDLEFLLKRPPSSEECERAQHLLGIAFELKVQTIHSFAKDMLDQFPIEAGLSPTFSLLEDDAYQEFLKNLPSVLLSDLKSDIPLKECLDIFLPFFSLFSFKELLDLILENRSPLENFLATHTHEPLPNKDLLQQFLYESLKDISIPHNSLKKISLIFKQEEDVNFQNKGAFLNSFLESSPEERITLYSHYLDLFLTQQKTPRVNLLNKRLKTEHPLLFEDLLKEQLRLLNLEETLKDMSFNVFTRAFYKLSSCVFDRYLSFKQEKNSYDYTDLLLKARDLLKDSEKAPWIFYKLDSTINHILLDEAQDTSPLCWEILTLLLTRLKENSTGIPKTLFVVGDEKQSIYSFQGADPEIFKQHESLFEQLAHIHNESWHTHKLELSYRSTEAVLKTVDTIFSSKNVSAGVSTKEKISHETFRINHPGRVEMWPLLTPDKKNQSWDPLEFKTLSSQPSHPERILAQTLAEHIEQLIQKKEILPSTKKPIQYGDILILVRRRTLLIEELIYFLKNKGIPVLGQDRILLKDHLGIQDLLVIAQWTLFPDDDLSLATLLKGPFFSFSEENLFHICWGRQDTLFKALQEKSDHPINYAKTLKVLEEMRSLQKQNGPFTFFSLLLTHLNGRLYFLDRFGQEINEILDEFLTLIYELEQRKGMGLHECIHWIQRSEIALKRTLDTHHSNQVRIMTVHGSKGLESPYVIITDTTTLPRNPLGFSLCWKGQTPVLIPPKELRPKHLDPLLLEARKKSLEEYRRLLYVALTRAQDHLLITGFLPTGNTPLSHESWWTLTHDALKLISKPIPFSFLENSRNAWSGEGFILESGIFYPKHASHEEVSHKEKAQIPDWFYEQASQDFHPINTIRVTGMEELSGASKNTLERGEILHLFLEKLPAYPESSWSHVTEVLLKQSTLSQIPDEKESQQKVFSILKNPDLQFLFGPNSYGEIPLMGTLNGAIFSTRLDRLVVSKDVLWIVDYKSDKIVPLSPSLIPNPYLKQLLIYRTLLQPLYPQLSIKLGILWIETGSLMEIHIY